MPEETDTPTPDEEPQPAEAAPDAPPADAPEGETAPPPQSDAAQAEAATAEAPAEDAPAEGEEAEGEEAEEQIGVQVDVEDAGVCKKKLTVTVPREAIEKKLDERFTELEEDAQVPGFRPGHAPRRLIEKRFRRAVTDEVRIQLLSEGLQEALQGEELQVIGEPDLDPDDVELPDEGDMSFSVELEVRPEFELPDYEGIRVEVERPEVSDADVDEALEKFRQSNAELATLAANAKVKENDYIRADLAVKADGETVVERSDAAFRVEPIAIEGIVLETLPEIVVGTKAGEEATGEVALGDDCPKEELRGKTAEVSVTVHEIRRLKPPSDEDLLEQTDYESMEELRSGLRRQQQAQTDQLFSRRQETAVQEWLLEKADVELPEELAKRHADSVARREMVDLLYRGVPADEVRKHEEEIRSASGERAARDLKLRFVLDAIAEKEDIEATDAEVDARVSYIARQYGRREDRVREEMGERGTLDSLRSQIREDKVMRLLLEKAEVEEVPAGESEGKAKAEEAEEVEEAEADQDVDTT
jgi:trigger factor